MSRSSSQKPSNRPAATQARSSAAEPKRRMPGDLRARSRRRSSTSRPRSPRPEMRNAGADQRFVEVAPRRDAQARGPGARRPGPFRPRSSRRSAAGRRGRGVISRLPARACGSSTAIEMAKCGMPWRKLVVPSSGSTIQRGLVGIALDLAAFLEQQAPVGPGVAQLLDDRLLGALVGHRDEVGRALAADLQLLDLAEVAAQAAAPPCARRAA